MRVSRGGDGHGFIHRLQAAMARTVSGTILSLAGVAVAPSPASHGWPSRAALIIARDVKVACLGAFR